MSSTPSRDVHEGWDDLPGLAADDPASVDLRHVRDHKFVKRDKRGCGHVDAWGAVCGGAKTHPMHHGCPPSMNVHGSGANRFEFQRQKHQWQDLFVRLLRESGLPTGLGHVLAEGQACFPDRIERDQGNHRFMVEKALGDALVEGGWLEKDDWTRYEFGRLRHAYDKGQAWLALTIHPSSRPLAEGGG
jgi:hypothetical protein